jgi:hypothetical protein
MRELYPQQFVEGLTFLDALVGGQLLVYDSRHRAGGCRQRRTAAIPQPSLDYCLEQGALAASRRETNRQSIEEKKVCLISHKQRILVALVKRIQNSIDSRDSETVVFFAACHSFHPPMLAEAQNSRSSCHNLLASSSEFRCTLFAVWISATPVLLQFYPPSIRTPAMFQ